MSARSAVPEAAGHYTHAGDSPAKRTRVHRQARKTEKQLGKRLREDRFPLDHAGEPQGRAS